MSAQQIALSQLTELQLRAMRRDLTRRLSPDLNCTLMECYRHDLAAIDAEIDARRKPQLPDAVNRDWERWLDSNRLDALLVRSLIVARPELEQLLREVSEASFTQGQTHERDKRVRARS